MTVGDLVKTFKSEQIFTIERRAIGKYNEINEYQQLSCRDELIFNGTKDDFFQTFMSFYESRVRETLQNMLIKSRHLVRSYDVVEFDIYNRKIVVNDPLGELKIS